MDKETHTYTSIHTHTYTHSYTYIHTCTHSHTYTHSHTHFLSHTHTYTYTHYRNRKDCLGKERDQWEREEQKRAKRRRMVKEFDILESNYCIIHHFHNEYVLITFQIQLTGSLVTVILVLYI